MKSGPNASTSALANRYGTTVDGNWNLGKGAIIGLKFPALKRRHWKQRFLILRRAARTPKIKFRRGRSDLTCSGPAWLQIPSERWAFGCLRVTIRNIDVQKSVKLSVRQGKDSEIGVCLWTTLGPFE